MPSEDVIEEVYEFIPRPNMHYLCQILRMINAIYKIVSFKLNYLKFKDTSHAMYFSRLLL